MLFIFLSPKQHICFIVRIVFLAAENDFVAKGLSYGKSVDGHIFCEGKTADIDERHDFSSCVLMVSVMPSLFPIGLS
jgi:hypothetical protein